MALQYFVATDNQSTGLGTELWLTDGTAAGTKLASDINLGPASSFPANFVMNAFSANNNSVFFTATTATNGTELWVFNPTNGNVARLDTGSATYKNVIPSSIAAVGALTVFAATDNTASNLGTEWFFTDGTAAGTTMIDINTGSPSSTPTAILPLSANNGANGVFVATTAANGTQLYLFDSTNKTVTRLDSGTASYANVVPTSIVGTNNAKEIFVATDNTATKLGTELYATDGTAAGTKIFDINVGTGSSNPANLSVDTANTQFAYFTANDGVHGLQVYRYNSQGAGGVERLDALTTGSAVSYNNLVPSSITPVGNGQVAFVATDATATNLGAELWTSNGASGTKLIDINTGAASSNPSNFVFDNRGNNGNLYFTATDATNGTELWRYDSTTSKATRLDPTTAGYTNVVPSSIDTITDTKVIFTATDNTATKLGTELYVSDRTAAGTTLIDLNPGAASSNPGNFVNFNTKVFFTATSGTFGTELWRYDATKTPDKATTRLDPLTTGTAPSYSNLVASSITHVNTFVIFAATDATATGLGTELWSTDGTAAGTKMFDINIGPGSSAPSNFSSSGNNVFFTANDGVHGVQEYFFDATDNKVLRMDSLPSASTASYTGPVLATPTTYTVAAANAVQLGNVAGQLAFTFTVSRIGDSGQAQSLRYSVAGSGTNAATASSFAGGVLPSGTIMFAGGAVSATITVNVVGNPALTQSQGFTVSVTDANGENLSTDAASFTTATAAGTIAVPVPTITPTSTQATVSGAGGVPFAVNFSSGALATQGRAQLTALGAGTQVAAASSGGALPAVVGSPGVVNIDSSGLVTMPGGYGAALITASGPVSLISAAAGDQMVVASGAGDLLYSAVSGTETIYAGSGKSTLFGNSSSLNIFGGDGASSIIGGTGGLTANMGPGGGIVFGTPGGGNTLSSGTGNATLVGGGAGDVVTSTGPGSNALIAAGGAETLNASGATGPNVFFGGSGADVMIGGSGNDLFLAGSANETLTGGAGNNTYVFNAATGTTRVDTITDFDVNRNGIFLFGYGTAANANAAALATQKVVGGVTQVTLTDGTQINFTGAPTLTKFNFFT